MKQYKVPKALIEIDGKPIILYLINRLISCKKIRNIVVCTTNTKSDDPLVKLLEESNISLFRGNKSSNSRDDIIPDDDDIEPKNDEKLFDKEEDSCCFVIVRIGVIII